MKFQILNISSKSDSHANIQWCFDGPTESSMGQVRVDSGVFAIEGWVFSALGSDVQLVVKEMGVVRAYPINKYRPDVVEHFSSLPSGFCINPLCGFSVSLALSGDADFGFFVGDELLWVKRLRIIS